MAKIRKIYDQTIKPDGSKTTIYPITSTRAVYTPEGATLDSYLKDGYFHGADLAGYKVVYNVSQLPTSETSFGYLMDGNLYVWVGTNGNVLDGKYQNCGPFRGPAGYNGQDGVPGRTGSAGLQGPKGDKGDKGDSGVDLGQVALTTALAETETGKALDASVAQYKIGFIDGEQEIEDVPSNYYNRNEVDQRIDALQSELDQLHPNIIYGDVTNAPDEEDITSNVRGTLSLKDRPGVDGKGYYILRKNKSFAEQVVHPNSEYEIRYDFDLLDEEVSLPENCVLKFVGGSLNNGTLVGANTGIEYSGTIFSNVTISGTWLVPEIKSSMFSDCTSRNTLKSLFALQNSNIQNRVIVEKDADNYLVSFTSGNILTVRSNTEVILNGSIELEPTNVTGYNILHLTGNNIKVSGGGSIIGDKEDHDYSSGGTHEWGFGIRIWNNCKDVIIDGLEISECTGDGIYQNSVGESQPENIVIRNVTIHDCRRQGITLMGIQNCIIENFNIYNIVGTDPRSAIDIEPNGASGPSTTSGVIIRNGLIDNVYYGIISSKQEDPSTHQEYEHTVFKDIDISNITITNCRMTAIQTYKFERAKISNCSISNKVYGINVQGGMVDIKNCSISTEAMERSGVYTGTCVFNISSTVNVNNCRLDGYNAVRTMNGVNISNSIITTSAGFNQLETGSTSRGSIVFSTITCAGFIKGLAPLVLKNNTINCNKIALGRDSVIEQNVMEGNATSLTDNFIGPVDGYTPKFIVKDNNITVTDAKYKYLIHVLANTKSIVYGNVISGNNYSGTGQGRFIGVATGNFISNFSGYPSYGALTSRPVFDTNNAADDSIVGLVYFDTTNNRPIWHKGNNVWVDATGNVIS